MSTQYLDGRVSLVRSNGFCPVKPFSETALTGVAMQKGQVGQASVDGLQKQVLTVAEIQLLPPLIVHSITRYVFEGEVICVMNCSAYSYTRFIKPEGD